MRARSANTRLFVLAGVLVGLALAMLVGPFASSSPDGLEKVAEQEGFAGSAEEHPLAGSPLADYGVEGVDDERAATGLSGVIGVLLTFGIALGLFATVRALRGDGSAPRGGTRTDPSHTAPSDTAPSDPASQDTTSQVDVPQDTTSAESPPPGTRS